MRRKEVRNCHVARGTTTDVPRKRKGQRRGGVGREREGEGEWIESSEGHGLTRSCPVTDTRTPPAWLLGWQSIVDTWCLLIGSIAGRSARSRESDPQCGADAQMRRGVSYSAGGVMAALVAAALTRIGTEAR